ncbi:DNA polymerase Y family protein [Mycobacterium sp. DBP42]|uniref:DNA polymerase Y family protein n=1 Tax=Mycobacterium sp. DBP42 TaxID=2545267 RepID=UPI00110CDC66|nr:DNA polymerase Y family protein [Mycobacterium sp. DBP42]TMS46374.1 DNA polymerase Y family protein [Mycobacterium sp. DBP42]
MPADSRVLALWCMDWPAVAAATAAGLTSTVPVAVTLANRVIACSASARAAGVRRGLRRREAQGRCPQLHVVTADPARDARHFENVTLAIDDLVPRAEVLRPGLLVLSVRGAARYFGSESVAAERLIDAVAAAGAECQVGIADQLSTAVFAARAGCIVEPGADARFLSGLSIRQLSTEPALAAPGREDLADLLWRMGIRTLGQFAELSRTDIASRFGADAVAAHRFACGEPDRGPSGRDPAAELDAVMNCDPPIERVDAAAFAGRSLASDLHRHLEAAGVGCTRLAIHAVTANGEELERVWRCAEPLTEDATADRVRWQLDGWLNCRTIDRPSAPLVMLRLRPVEVVSAAALQLPLWGGLGEEDRLRARRALLRVQGLLGPEAVQVPVLSGGRGPAERITFTPLGDEPVPRADPRQPWPGQLPEPSPTVLLDDPVELLDVQGNPVRVTSRGLFSADPAQLTGAGRRDGRLCWWAGPWPVDERWWDPENRGVGRTARVQVLLGSGDREGGDLALLLCYRQRRWYLEGAYE